ncbi:Na+/H+ antiporter NhaC family protein [Marinifilum sp.]|uniref:Na+/H+ antiporter NhaC family protein n=1 Tax=Marinifilum sp. TaxID=2033137 RepID=UPI003BA93DBC
MLTAIIISKILISTEIPPQFLPTFPFFLSALIAFSIGSSWGILILSASRMIDAQSITVSAILAGSVLSDHCPPISDTTILSLLASSCKHIEHVRTQLFSVSIFGLNSYCL